MVEETTYKAGDDVFVIDSAFEPSVQRGTVGIRDSSAHQQTIDVIFNTDPFTGDSNENREIGVDPMQVIHADADAGEMYRLFGREDLIMFE